MFENLSCLWLKVLRCSRTAPHYLSLPAVTFLHVDVSSLINAFDFKIMFVNYDAISLQNKTISSHSETISSHSETISSHSEKYSISIFLHRISFQESPAHTGTRMWLRSYFHPFIFIHPLHTLFA